MPPDKTGANPGASSFGERSPPHISDHELIRCIGEGSYGEVWLAKSVTRRYRAVKVVYRKSFDQERPYEREFTGILKFEPLSRKHDGFVDVLQAGRDDAAGYFYYVMELGDDQTTAQEIHPTLYKAKTLRTEIQRRGKLSVNECVDLGLSLTAALEHLHGHGLIHRDIKPSNIIFVDGIPKLADIGLVVNVTEARSFVGTEGFIPPEGPGTCQSDLYSLGKVLYEACTGKDRLDFPELPSDVGELPDGDRLLELNEIILTACESDPRRRFRTAHQMHGELELLKRGKSVKRKRKRERRLALLVRGTLASAVVAVLAGVTFLQVQKQTERKQFAADAKVQRVKASAQQADALVSQGDAFSSGGRWAEAKVSYQQAADAFTKLGMSTTWPDVGLCLAFEHSPPEINCFTGHQSNVMSVVFSPNGRLVLSGGYDNTLRLWDVQTGREVRKFTGHAEGIESVDFSPDGRLVVSGGKDNTVRLWEVATGRELRTLTGHKSWVESVAFSPDGRRILSGGYDNTLRLWDVETGRELSRFTVTTEGIESLAFSTDGRLVVTGGLDATVRLWEVATGREVRKFTGHVGGIESVDFSPDGRLVVSGGKDSTVRLWEVATGREVRKFTGHVGGIESVDFSPDGRLVVSGGKDSTVRLWEVATGRELRTFTGHTEGIETVAFSPDSRLVVSGGDDHSVRLWEVAARDEQRVFTGHQDWVNSAVFSPDGRMMLSGSKDDTVRLWDVDTGRELRMFTGHQSWVTSVAFSPDGRQALSGSADDTVRLWDVATGRELRTMTGHENSVTSVAFSPDGRLALSGGGDNTMRLWDVATGREVRSFRQHIKKVLGVAFSPDGREALSGSADNTVRLWDVATGRELRTMTGHEDSVTSVAFSPDGREALSGSADDTVRLWDVDTGRELRTLTGHENTVASVAFSPDGRFALSGSYDKTMRLWEVATGRELRALTGHQSFVRSVAFSPDGRQALSASTDNTLRLWDFSRSSDYRTFETRLADARKALRDDPNNAGALATLGDWYAFRGLWDWAADLLGRARQSGAAVSSLVSARCYWEMNDIESAHREFQLAREHKEAPDSYLQLCLSAVQQGADPLSSFAKKSATGESPNAAAEATSEVTRQMHGYRILNDEMVFDFRPADYEWTTSNKDGKRVRLSEVNIKKVCVAGEFNGWERDQWVLQKAADLDHYELRRKLSEFTGKSEYQFKFVINGDTWVEPPMDAANRVSVGGNVFNLYLTLR